MVNDGGKNDKVRIDRKVIRWRPPQGEWIKINFDGTSKGNKGLSGAGAIARNAMGDINCFAAKRLVDGTNMVVEMEAALLAVLLGKKLDVMHLHLEGDSKIIIDGIIKGSMQQWIYHHPI